MIWGKVLDFFFICPWSPSLPNFSDLIYLKSIWSLFVSFRKTKLEIYLGRSTFVVFSSFHVWKTLLRTNHPEMLLSYHLTQVYPILLGFPKRIC